MERRYLKAIINNKTTRTNIINNTYILHHVHLFVASLSTDDFDDNRVFNDKIRIRVVLIEMLVVTIAVTMAAAAATKSR